MSAIPSQGLRSKIFLHPQCLQMLFAWFLCNFFIFWGKIKVGTCWKKKDQVISKWCSLRIHLRHMHCLAVRACPFPPTEKKAHEHLLCSTNTEAQPQQAEMGSWCLRTQQSHPGLPGVPVLQRSAVWNWHQAKTGCEFPGAVSEQSTGRRSLRHLRKLQVKRHGDMPAKSLLYSSS